ncbi:hypothetical protein PV405_00350 [Streptomyces sp. ME02-6979-3A]|uniref:PIN domain-containing protein n=1 Tax=Streptomyces silvae TaxID=2803812 RepID=A0ABU8A5X2_9ACTN|nr:MULTISPECIES: hypothetical protein [unclassified Streptomyces]MDX3323144.1 hypothetical protein [Streptomyces sp. ME02-6979-3A]
MIYLLDTSGLVRLLGDTELQSAWYDTICADAVGSCYPQRAEFLFSARTGGEYDEIVEMFTDLYPDVPVPKNAGRWIGAVQQPHGRPARPRPPGAPDSRRRLSRGSPAVKVRGPAGTLLAQRQGLRRRPDRRHHPMVTICAESWVTSGRSRRRMSWSRD